MNAQAIEAPPENHLMPQEGRGTTQHRDTPYTWSTTVAKLLGRSAFCRWSTWLRTHFTHARLPATVSLATWQLQHGAMQHAEAHRLKGNGYQVAVGPQNRWQMRNATGATLAGAPDLVARNDDGDVLIVNVYPHEPKSADTLDTLISVYALARQHPDQPPPRAALLYPGGRQEIDADTFTRELPALKQSLHGLMQIILDPDTPPERTPAWSECRYCDVSPSDCPERITEDPQATAGA